MGEIVTRHTPDLQEPATDVPPASSVRGDGKDIAERRSILHLWDRLLHLTRDGVDRREWAGEPRTHEVEFATEVEDIAGDGHRVDGLVRYEQILAHGLGVSA